MHERLYRSRDERVIFGVCGGLAERLDVDPSLVRIVFALLVLSAGVGLGLYIVMALVVPEEPWGDSAGPAMPAGVDAAMGPAGVDAAADPASAAFDAPLAGGAAAGATGAASAGLAGGAPGTAGPAQPMSRREERRARRVARRTRGDNRPGMVIGGILIFIGVWFLVRHYLPTISDDFLGPLLLIGLGLVLVVGAVGVRSSGDGTRRPR